MALDVRLHISRALWRSFSFSFSPLLVQYTVYLLKPYFACSLLRLLSQQRAILYSCNVSIFGLGVSALSECLCCTISLFSLRGEVLGVWENIWNLSRRYQVYVLCRCEDGAFIPYRIRQWSLVRDKVHQPCSRLRSSLIATLVVPSPRRTRATFTLATSQARRRWA